MIFFISDSVQPDKAIHSLNALENVLLLFFAVVAEYANKDGGTSVMFKHL